MKTLLWLGAALAATGGLAGWQHAELDRCRQRIQTVAAELAEQRTRLVESRDELSSRRTEGLRIRRQVRGAEEALLEARSKLPRLPTFAGEGGWPDTKPYFYLPKTLLPWARLRDRDAIPEAVVKAGGTPGALTYSTIENRLFNREGLNELMVSLLGLDAAEKRRVEQIYEGLGREIKELEASTIARVDPPEPVGEHGQKVFARIPDLTGQVGPLLAKVRDDLQAGIGEQRAAVLMEEADRFFSRHCDFVGRKAREFYGPTAGTPMYQVRYLDPDGNVSYGGETFGPAGESEWKYAHLFGPGAPCELK